MAQYYFGIHLVLLIFQIRFKKLDIQKLPRKIRKLIEREKPIDEKMMRELEQEFK